MQLSYVIILCVCVCVFQYQSFKKDDVLGIIKQKSKGEHYAIDVACREQRPQLSKNAFEGATKRYRPDLQVLIIING